MRIATLAACLFAALLMGACSESPTSPAASGGSSGPQLTGRLTLTGSSTVAPLMAEIGKRFESLHPAVRIDVQTGGSSRGITDTRAGPADIGMVSRALRSEEADLMAHTIALDGVCVILHADNPVASLTDQQIVDIYTDRINNWSQVGGRDATITVVNKAEGRSTLELFLSHFQLPSAEVKPDVVIGDNQQGIKTVAGNPDAIGYVSIGSAEYDSTNGAPIKLLPMGSTAASIENVRNGTFPLSRPLNLVTRAAPEGLAKAFIEYVRGEGVHDLVWEMYFVPVE